MQSTNCQCPTPQSSNISSSYRRHPNSDCIQFLGLAKEGELKEPADPSRKRNSEGELKDASQVLAPTASETQEPAPPAESES